jgi:hypothetical protein
MIRLPPFAKLAGKHPSSKELRIYVGSNYQLWDVTRLRNAYAPAVLLPPGDDFRAYRWPVNGREVLMLQVGDFQTEAIHSFACDLLRAGAVIVRVLHSEGFDTFLPQRRAAA